MSEARPRVTIYSDGSAVPNPGAGGYAAILRFGDAEKIVFGTENPSTNNRMELMAAIAALEALTRPCDVDFYTDSQYLRKGISEWIHGWIRNGWLTSARKPVENKALWQRLLALTEQHTIHWQWVRGHANNALNERVDRLANDAREGRL